MTLENIFTLAFSISHSKSRSKLRGIRPEKK
jgi:hypothetical protein